MSTPQFWGADAPTQGAYKSHDVAEVFKPAGYASLLFSLAGKRRLKSGEALTVPAYSNLDFPTSTALDEDDTIPLSKLSITAKTISMSERGRAVAVTGRAVNRSPIDILMAHKDAVAEMMTRELEEVVSTALKTMPIKGVITSSTAVSITTNGSPSGTRSGDINVYLLQYLSNYLSDNKRVPMDPRYGSYVGIFRGNAILSVQSDSDYFELHRGMGLKAIDTLNVGKIADTQLFKLNDDRVLDNAQGTGNANSEGFILGKDAVLFGVIEDIGLHFDFSKSKATDFGRKKYIAWVGDYGAGLYSDSANADLVRGIHLTE